MNDNLNGMNPNPNMAVPGAPAPVGGIPEMPAAPMGAAPMQQPMAPAMPAAQMQPMAPAAPMGGLPEMPAGGGIPEMPAAPMQQPMAPAMPAMQPMAPAMPQMPAAPAMQPMPPATPAPMQQPMGAPTPVAVNPMGMGPGPATPVSPVMPAAPAMPQMPGALPQPNQAPAGKEKKEIKGPPKKVIIGAAILIVGLLFFLVGLPYINSLGEGPSVNQEKGEEYIKGAKGYIKYVKDNLPSYAAGFTCGETTNSLLLTLHDLKDYKSGITKSPFGEDIDMSQSFIEIDAIPNNGNCEFVYLVYITDGKYSIGTEGAPVKESELTIDSVIEQ